MSDKIATLVVTLGLFASGCAQRTEVVVGVATDLQTPSLIDVVRMTLTDDTGGLLVEREWPLGQSAGQFALPASFGVGPTSSTSFTVHVEGVANNPGNVGGSGTVVVSRHARLGFVDGKTLFVRLLLATACAGDPAASCPAGTWCAEGVCRPIDISASTLPDYHAGDELGAQCGAATTATAFHLAPPASATCANGAACLEAVCIGGAHDDGPAPLAIDGAAQPIDLAGVVVPDLAEDGAPSSDLLADLAQPDLAPPDLTVSATADLVMLSTPNDLATSDGAIATQPDLTMTMMAPPDLAQPDFAIPVDAAHPDLAQPDLAQPDLAIPDLVMMTPAPDLAAPPAPPFYWVTPLPSGENVNGLAYDGTSANTTGSALWGVNASGDALRLDSSGQLIAEPTGAGVSLSKVLLSGAEVWASGAGVIMHRDSSGVWHRLPFPRGYETATAGNLVSDGAGGIIAATDQGFLVRADISKVTVRDATPPAPPFGLASGTDSNGQPCLAFTTTAYVTQYGGTYYSFDSSQGAFVEDTGVNQVFGTTNNLYFGLTGCGGDNTVVVGQTSNQPIAARRANGQWKAMPIGSNSLTGANKAFTQPVVFSSTDIYAWMTDPNTFGGNHSTPVHFDGSYWSAVMPYGSPMTSWAEYGGGPPPFVVGKDASGSMQMYVAFGPSVYGYNPNLNNDWVLLNATHAQFDGKPWGDGKKLLVAPAPPPSMGAPPQIWFTTDLDTPGAAWQQSPINSGGHTISLVSQVVGVDTGNGSYRYYASADNGVILTATDLKQGFTVDSYSSDGRVFWGITAADANNVYAAAGFLYNNGTNNDAWIMAKLNGGSWATVNHVAGSGNQFARFQSIMAISASEVFAGGSIQQHGSYIVRGSNTTWSVVYDPNDKSPLSDTNGIWGATANDVWAVGDGLSSAPILLHYDGTGSFERVPVPRHRVDSSPSAINAIFGTSANDIFAVTPGSDLFHYDGSGWSLLPMPDGWWDGVWVDAHHIVVGGTSPTGGAQSQVVEWLR